MPLLGSRGNASIKALGFGAAGKPTAPTIGTATRTSAAISIPFTANYDGGSTVTLYTATSTPGNYTFTANGSPITATGLILGISYTFQVYAQNNYGSSLLSQSSNGVVYASIPNAPVIGSASANGATSATVSFTAPNNGGEPIIQYTAYALVNNAFNGESGTVSQSGSGTITVNGLTAGTNYTFKLVAINALGNSNYSVASNSVTPNYTPRGTYQGQFCAGPGNYNLYYIYADGSGGTYSSLYQANSPLCGYVQPTITGITLSTTLYYQSYPPYTNTKGTTVIISNGSSISGASYSVTTDAGLDRNLYFNQPTSGTLAVGAGTYITYNGPHSATTARVTVSKSGYTSYSGTISLAANTNYSPYTIYQGFLQESGYAYSAALAYAVYQYYAGSGTFYVTQDPGVIRYQLYRAPDYGGLVYWCSFCISNAIDPSSQQFRDAFGSAPETFTGPKTSYNPGTGFNMFYDRP